MGRMKSKFLISAILTCFSVGFLLNFRDYDDINGSFTLCFIFLTFCFFVWSVCSEIRTHSEKRILKIFLISILCIFNLIFGFLAFASNFPAKNAALAFFLLTFCVTIVFAAWLIYEFFYYRTRKFKEIKERIAAYTKDCNDLNDHIESLKETSLLLNRTDYGKASYYDTSRWNYKRAQLKKQKYAPNIYSCSRTVCDNARKKPFEYVCKYFGIKATEENLAKIEEILNNFEAAEDGKKQLQNEKKMILESIKSDIPFLIRRFSKKLDKKLGFHDIDMSTAYFPRYIFQYISSGGNASMRCDVIFDIDNLNRFVQFLAEKVRFRKSVAGQRALMTSKLRQQIKERDHYTCRICGASVYKEPNLLLEIDHIVPVSKGGLTTEDNLQTLCWRCNRSKGAKVS